MKKGILSGVVAAMSVALATEFNASVQGDVASLKYWQDLGYSSLPGATDTLKLSVRATSPMYFASSDMSIGNVLFSCSGSFIDLTAQDGSLRTITLNSSGSAMEFSSGSAGYKLLGGKWYLAYKGSVHCGRANTGSLDNHTIEFDGCVITNVNRFYGAYYDRSTTVKLVNGAEIYAENLYPAYGNYASNSLVSVSGGSKFVSIGRMIFGDGFDGVWSETSEVGNNLIEVSGAGSLLKMGGISLFGHKVPRNTIKILDGAALESSQINVGSSLGNGYGHDSSIFVEGQGTTANTGTIVLGPNALSHGCRFEIRDGANWYSSSSLTVGEASHGNRAVVSNATGSCGSVILGNGVLSSNNVFIVDDGGNLTVRSGNMLKVGVNGSFNRAEIIDSTVAFGDTGRFIVGENASSTGNVLRISGGNALVSLPDPKNLANFDPFGAGSWNTVVLENGASIGFDGQYEVAFSDNVSNNCFSVRNATLSPDAHFHFGTVNSTGSSHNRMELLDGACAQFKSFTLSASSNTLFVSNSTMIASTDTGVRIGFVADSSDAGKVSGNTVVVSGENALISSVGNITLSNGSRIHFSIPRKGYASVPVKSNKMFAFDATSSISVDCEEFCKHTGGGIVLIETVSGIDQKRIQQVLDAANKAGNLPPGARLYVSGNNLMFRSPHVMGTVVVVR